MSDNFPTRFVQIDEEGFLISDGLRQSDEDYGQEVLKSFYRDDRNRIIARIDGSEFGVESFDEPYVIRHIEHDDLIWTGILPYGLKVAFDLHSLSLDEWDRFHGLTETKIPFVFSRSAQAEFFNQLDEFDDDSITANGNHIELKPWLLPPTVTIDESFWTEIYKADSGGWELGREANALKDTLAQLKLPRMRVLVPGCGSGHDAAFFAQHGHIVTAVDVSPEAITKAQAKYGDIPNLKFIQADAFNLPASYNQSYDLVFEHAFYCAVSPDLRNDLVKKWTRWLAENGHLLGIFFAVDRRMGPPWGGSEWELRARLKQRFDARFWTRWRHSIPKRQGIEVVVYAQKRAELKS